MNLPVKTIAFFTTLLISMPCFSMEWPFKAFLDGKEIGEHRFVLDQSGDQAVLKSEATFNVKFLFINAYRYRHTADEVWEGDCLRKLDARTEENRDVSVVKGMAEGNTFALQGPKGEMQLPSCPMTFAYWNPAMLKQRRLLNPQTGEWLDVRIRALGTEPIEARGQSVMANRYRLEATKMKIDLWYSPEKEWLALESTTPEGYLLRYELR